MLRIASEADAAALLSIYGRYIDTSVTFEYTLPATEAFRARIRDILAEYPYLVWEEGGRILGYAYAHRFRERAAYRWGAELSVYLDPDARGRGLGRTLYEALIRLLILQGVKTVYGCITLPNDASVGLHEAMGFTRAGVFRSAGWKGGRWHDIVWYERVLDPGDTAAPFLPFPTIKDRIEREGFL